MPTIKRFSQSLCWHCNVVLELEHQVWECSIRRYKFFFCQHKTVDRERCRKKAKAQSRKVFSLFGSEAAMFMSAHAYVPYVPTHTHKTISAWKMNSIRLSFLFHLLHSCCFFNTFVGIDGMGRCCMKSAGKRKLSMCICVYSVFCGGWFGNRHKFDRLSVRRFRSVIATVARCIRISALLTFSSRCERTKVWMWDGDDGNALASSIHINVENRISFFRLQQEDFFYFWWRLWHFGSKPMKQKQKSISFVWQFGWQRKIFKCNWYFRFSRCCAPDPLTEAGRENKNEAKMQTKNSMRRRRINMKTEKVFRTKNHWRIASVTWKSETFSTFGYYFTHRIVLRMVKKSILPTHQILPRHPPSPLPSTHIFELRSRQLDVDSRRYESTVVFRRDCEKLVILTFFANVNFAKSGCNEKTISQYLARKNVEDNQCYARETSLFFLMHFF